MGLYVLMGAAAHLRHTPNLADSKQPLLLIVQGEEIRLDDSLENDGVLPKYRDMLRRLARDPVGQTVMFELVMRMFFLHVLGVRPECLQNRRGSNRSTMREWCSDGVAASTTACGIFGHILAFRGELEAQGRGSLHPHILIWLLGLPLHLVLRLLKRDKAERVEATLTSVHADDRGSYGSHLPKLGADVASPFR